MNKKSWQFFKPASSGLLNNIVRVDIRSPQSYFKVQVGAEGIARAPGKANERTLTDRRTHADVDLAQVCVDCNVTAAMIDLYYIPISVVVTTLCHGNNA
jgi:hypothetical protein